MKGSAIEDRTPSPASRPILTVSEVNQKARLLLERTFTTLTVVGEVSNHKISSGHHYFALKDRASVLPAVLFRRDAMRLRFDLSAGMEVIATGRLTLYPPYGRYQMVVDHVEPKGAGALQAAFEQLKEKLGREGLFAAERKRALPLLPRGVAVVTSPTGSVIRDIINVAGRRFPNAHILVVPARVQGPGAAAEIASGVVRANRMAVELGVDAIVVARGGGSLEELWPFNEEVVARAIAASALPVVSAVGHETDFTIADFVADQRAPTPSAAAELIFPIKSELQLALQRSVARGAMALRRGIQERRLRLRALRTRIGDGRRWVRDAHQRLAHLDARLVAASQRGLMNRRLRLQGAVQRLERLHPRVRLRGVRGDLRACHGRIVLLMRQRIASHRQRLAAAGRRLNALSPLGVLERGYSIVLVGDGQALRDPAQVASGDALDIRVAHGKVRAVVR